MFPDLCNILVSVLLPIEIMTKTKIQVVMNWNYHLNRCNVIISDAFVGN